MNTKALISNRDLLRLYWLMRLSMAFIWLWTAGVSWFIYPHAASLSWLRSIGITYQTMLVFVAACVFDLLIGIVSAIYPTRLLWQVQILVIGAYTVVIAIGLPEFLWHPFGPITKNLAVLACLGFLVMMEKWRSVNS